MGKIGHSDKLEIIRLHHLGLKATAISRNFSDRGLLFSRQQVTYWLNQYTCGYFDPTRVESKPVEFRKVTERDIEIVQTSLEANPHQSARDVQRQLRADGADISITTTKRVISAAGYTNSTPRYSQMVRDVNKEKRVVFCDDLIRTNDNMDDIIFSDECSIQLDNNKVTTYRQVNAHGCIPKAKHPYKLHVWGGISRRGKTKLAMFDGIMESTFFVNEILKNRLLPFINTMYPDGHRFQQDNDPKHRSKLAREFMEGNGINHWKVWPSESPDLNPIEMVWNQIKRCRDKDEPRTKDELVTSIRKFWNETLTTELCNRYIDHVFKVAPVCVLLRGKATADFPKKLFPTERSSGKSFRHFDELLKSETCLPKIAAMKIL